MGRNSKLFAVSLIAGAVLAAPALADGRQHHGFKNPHHHGFKHRHHNRHHKGHRFGTSFGLILNLGPVLHDRRVPRVSQRRALPVPVQPPPLARAWQNPDQCREFATQGTIGGRTETLIGRVCRQPDGTWKLAN